MNASDSSDGSASSNGAAGPPLKQEHVVSVDEARAVLVGATCTGSIILTNIISVAVTLVVLLLTLFHLRFLNGKSGEETGALDDVAEDNNRSSRYREMTRFGRTHRERLSNLFSRVVQCHVYLSAVLPCHMHCLYNHLLFLLIHLDFMFVLLVLLLWGTNPSITSETVVVLALGLCSSLVSMAERFLCTKFLHITFLVLQSHDDSSKRIPVSLHDEERSGVMDVNDFGRDVREAIGGPIGSFIEIDATRSIRQPMQHAPDLHLTAVIDVDDLVFDLDGSGAQASCPLESNPSFSAIRPFTKSHAAAAAAEIQKTPIFREDKYLVFDAAVAGLYKDGIGEWFSSSGDDDGDDAVSQSNGRSHRSIAEMKKAASKLHAPPTPASASIGTDKILSGMLHTYRSLHENYDDDIETSQVREASFVYSSNRNPSLLGRSEGSNVSSPKNTVRNLLLKQLDLRESGTERIEREHELQINASQVSFKLEAEYADDLDADGLLNGDHVPRAGATEETVQMDEGDGDASLNGDHVPRAVAKEETVQMDEEDDIDACLADLPVDLRQEAAVMLQPGHDPSDSDGQLAVTAAQAANLGSAGGDDRVGEVMEFNECDSVVMLGIDEELLELSCDRVGDGEMAELAATIFTRHRHALEDEISVGGLCEHDANEAALEALVPERDDNVVLFFCIDGDFIRHGHDDHRYSCQQPSSSARAARTLQDGSAASAAGNTCAVDCHESVVQIAGPAVMLKWRSAIGSFVLWGLVLVVLFLIAANLQGPQCRLLVQTPSGILFLVFLVDAGVQTVFALLYAKFFGLVTSSHSVRHSEC